MSVSGQGPLSFDAIINDSDYLSKLASMERRMLGFTSSTIRETNKMDQQFARLSQLVTGYFSFQALSQLPAQILQVRGAFQQLEISFSTMIGSKMKADALMSSLVETAATTPFSLQDVAGGAKQLLAYGSASGSVVGELRMLGDVASGVSVPLNDLVYLYGTLRTQGRAYATDIRQFAGRGIPIYKELATVLGVNVDKVNAFVESGKVGFKEVEQAFKNMTSNGGMFAGLMDAQSKSLLGLKERLSDAWDLMLNEIGKNNEGVAAQLLTTATDVVDKYQDVLDIIQIVAVGYGVYKAAVMAVSVVNAIETRILQEMAVSQSLAALSGQVLTTQQLRQAAITKLLQQAQAGLNATMLANPVVLVVTAVAALATAYSVLHEEAIQVKTAQELLAESSKNVSSNYQKQKAEVSTLTDVIKNQNVAESERKKAYDQLNSIAPDILRGLDFEKAKTADLTKELNLYLVSLEKKIRLEAAQGAYKSSIEQDLEATEKLNKAREKFVQTDEQLKKAQKNPRVSTGPDARSGGAGEYVDFKAAEAEYNAAVENKRKTTKVVADIKQTVSSIYTSGSTDSINAEIQSLETAQSKLGKLSVAYKYNEDRLKELAKQKEALTAADKKGQTVQVKTVESLDAEIKKLKELQDQQSNKAGYAQIQKQIDGLETQKRRITGELTKEEKKAAKDADKVGPLGSVSYYENIARKAQEALEKIPTSNKGKIAYQQAIILDANRKAEDARLAVTVRSFDEELAYKREQYILYQKWVENYGKDAADAQFGDLLASGQSYLDYLNTQINVLEKKREDGTLSKKDTKNLSVFLDDRTDITGSKSGIDKFREELGGAKAESASLTEYLVALKAKQDELNTKPNTAEWFKVRQEVAEQIVGAQQDLRTQLTQYLRDVTGSEEQRLAVTKKYAELRASLEEQYRGKRTSVGKVAEYQGKLGKINNGEADEIKEINERAVQASKAFKKLDEVMLESGRAALKKRLALLNEALEKEKQLADTQEYQSKLKERNDLQIAIKDDDLSRINEYGQLVGQLGEAYMQLGGEVGDAGAFMSGFAANLSLLTNAFKENQTQAEGIQNVLSATVSIISSITSAAQQRKQAEEAYYASMIAQQTQYNQLLNEQIGLQSEQNENVFVKDYAGRLKDRFAQLGDAQKGYMESLSKLNEGRVKTGQRDKVDWSAAGKNALSGAAIGTAILPGIGTVIGLFAGLAVGIFGAKKKADEFGDLLAEYPELIKQGANGQKEFNKELAQSLIDNNLLDDKSKQLIQNTLEWTKKMEEARAQIKAIVADLAGQLGDKLRDNLVNAFKEGTDSAIAFGDAVSDILESLVTKMLFSTAFNKVLQDLQDDMSASLDVDGGGDGNVVDDFQRFTENSKESLEQYNLWLKQFQDAAAASGISVLKPTNATASTPNSMSGAIKSVSEETASVIAGQMNAMRITQADTNGVIRQQLVHLSNISLNSNYLKSMDERLARIESNGKSDPLRAKGI